MKRLNNLEKINKERPLNRAERQEVSNLRHALESLGVNCKGSSPMQTALIADNIGAVRRYIEACNKAASRPGWKVQPHVAAQLRDIGIDPNYRELQRQVAEIVRTKNTARDTRNHRRGYGRRRPTSIRNRRATEHTATAMPAAVDPDNLTFAERYPEASDPVTLTDTEQLIRAYPDYKDIIIANMAPTS
ncbi:MAG: hypothetical protein K5837_03350 [Candidatus Saccharibacteria bacterium]|nr:hypothetical protein [Candidatus Saccharibacteria bacterium]